MKKYNILLWLMPVIVISCNKQREQYVRFSEEQIKSLHIDSTSLLNVETDSIITVDFNSFLKGKTYDMGLLIKEMILVPLETTNESLVSNPIKVIVSDSSIYIMDAYKGRGLIIFDRNGKFVKRLPNGQGPGELHKLYDFTFDKENNELIVYQHPFLMFFTPLGTFLRQTKLPFGFYNFTVIPEGYIFKTLDGQGNEHLENLQNYTLLVTDKNFKIISAGLPFPLNYNGLGNYNYVYNNNSIDITLTACDTIYQYLNEINGLKAKYVIDYNKKKMPDEYLFGGSYQDFDKAARQNNYFFYIGDFFDTDNHSYFNLKNFNGDVQVFRDKHSGNLIGGFDTNSDINVISFHPFIIYGTYRKYFISLLYLQNHKEACDKSMLLSEKNKQVIKNLKEDDNEVLIFYELKNF